MRGLVKREAELLAGILGRYQENIRDLWESAAAVILSREWSQVHARVFACWATLSHTGKTNIEGTELWKQVIFDLTISFVIQESSFS